MRWKLAVFSIGAAVSVCASTLFAADRLVPSQYATIQAGIDAALAGDTVVIAPGVYTGPGNRDLDFGGKAITLKSINPQNPNIVAGTVIDVNGTAIDIDLAGGEGPGCDCRGYFGEQLPMEPPCDCEPCPGASCCCPAVGPLAGVEQDFLMVDDCGPDSACGDIVLTFSGLDAGYWDPNGTAGDVNDDFGVDGDYHLRPASPCINAGDPDFVCEPADTDIDGEYRIMAPRVDMGVDEYPGNIRPVADAGSSRYAGSDPVQLDGTGSYDPDHSGALSYQWQQVSGPTVVITDADTATPMISGCTQTGSIQQCQFELVVSDGDLTSLPDTVEVIIVPSFSGTTLVLENPPFDPDKPTLIFFAGGTGGDPLHARSLWEAKANIISFSTPHNGGKFAEHGNAIITYLSSKAPNYNQPIQTTGISNGGKLPAAVGAYINTTYAEKRYNVNQATLWDAYHPSHAEIVKFLNSSVDGEQSWVANYRAAGPNNPYPGPEINGALNVYFPLGDHPTPMGWYLYSIDPDSLDWMGDVYNGGIVAGAYLSVVGKCRNLELACYPNDINYYFEWVGDNYGPGYLDFYNESSYPGRLPEPVTLVGPNDGDFVDANGALLSCEESENAVGYQLLMGSDPYRVADYNAISDTPYPPNEVITTIPFGRTWWTVRAYDQYGSTIYADPQEVRILKATNPSPADGAKDVARDVELSWSPGFAAASHDVYFGTDFDDLSDANKSSPEYKSSEPREANTYDPCGLLDLGTTHYWRIDEVNGLNTWAGDVWSFTTADYIIIVDDMQAYNTGDNKINDTWLDGYYNLTGAWLYLGVDPCDPVHGGGQSMKYEYENDGGLWGDLHYYSEAVRTFSVPCDWTEPGIKVLTLYFYGNPGNDADATEQMYVGLEDSSSYAQGEYGDNGEDMNDIKIAEWQEWNIRLQDFNDGGVDLSDISKMYIGFGDRENLNPGGTPGGTGVVYFDDIRLYPRKCAVSLAKPAADFDSNCFVDFRDLAVLGSQWRQSPGDPSADIAPEIPDGVVDWRDLAMLVDSWLQEQLWPPEE